MRQLNPTPGPWKLHRQFWQHNRLYVVDSTPPCDVRFVGQVIAYETTAPETIDNLHLISAALEMRDALAGLMNGNDCWCDYGYTSRHTEECKAAKAAYLKATTVED